MKIDGYEISFEDDYKPDNYKRFICEIYINNRFLAELSHEADPHQFEITDKGKCIEDDVPLCVISKAIDEGKKRLMDQYKYESNILN